ncbi:extracellular solute-binding protein [Microbacterium sp. NEAU-LLC]|uniref:Extracellular solute-binding protein n=2 Tax=Microbacterium helvum TaxID=2773713 RepID=A0ABR8NKM4_9MICO|nr:extracellular solute-binding protein [Microbacterium helvum]
MHWLVASAGVLTLGLAGCSSSGDSPSDAEDGELTVWVMGDSSEHFDTLIAPFEKDSGIDVETVAIPWDSVDQKFTTAVASGEGPDVLQIGLSKLRTYADSGALLTLDDKTIADYPNLAASNFIDGIAGDATAIDGKIVSAPWVSDTRVLFYRSDILAEAGIDTPPATWDELREAAKTLADRGDGQYGYYIPQWDSALPVVMTWDQGGDIVADGAIDFDTPEFAQAVDLYTGLYADGSVPTNSDFDQTQGFVSGITPMLVSGPYLGAAIKDAAPELDGKWDVTTVPAGTDSTSLLAGSNLGVWGATDNQSGALELLDYLSQPEVQVQWYELDGQLPTVKAALADDALTTDPLVAVYSEQLANSRLLPLVPNWDGETGKALLDALNSIVLTGADRDAAMETLFTTTAGTPAN